MKKYALAACLPVILLVVFVPLAQAGDALKFFNNWFVTGDYAVAGVGLKNSGGTGAIPMEGVPCTLGAGPAASIVPCTTAGAVPAQPVAAFLYWQTVESPGTAAPKGTFNGKAIEGRAVGSDATSACWITAPSQVLRTYRADVLRFLPVDANGVRLANGTHQVSLGLVNATSRVPTLGASLVVIYRVVAPGKPLIAPLRSIVVYDGEFTLTKGGADMTQGIGGFYQAAAVNQAARMTHIVGNGQLGFREILKVHDDTPASISANQPFLGAQGPNWDNLTFAINLDPNASATDARASVAGGDSNCLSWGAIITSTNVQDTDNDGLLDVWETRGIHRNTQVAPATFGGCADYPAEACANLPAMGAVNGVRDIFLQIDWMHGNGDGTGGTNGLGQHSHMPKLAALDAVANAFVAKGIALHFDVGNNFQSPRPPYIIPSGLARGGADFDESYLLCDPSTAACAYNVLYPVLSFKLGFNSIRDGNQKLSRPLDARLDQNRKDAFHYALFAHALAGPFNLVEGKIVPDGPARSYSGIGDRPGADLMVTLGLWRSDIPANDQVGSVTVQAGTLMHELGHNLNLSHAGWTSGPNCAPNYQSVMSYLYQTRGLTTAAGAAKIDYSNGLLNPLDEGSLSASTMLGPLAYRLRFYGPLGPNNSSAQAAQRHCDGTDLVSGETPAMRLEAPDLTTPDWFNGNPPLLPLNLNFDKFVPQVHYDRPDWSSLNLQQIGSRTNFGSLSVGSLATDVGSLATDVGSLATDVGSLATDVGSLATDVGSLATDVGSLATDVGSLATDVGDIDYDTHIRTTTDSIPGPGQCLGCGLKAANGLEAITLSWTPPETGGTLKYNIYRCAGTTCAPALFKSGWVPASKTEPAFTDTVNDTDPAHSGAACPSDKTCYNTTYKYAATAVSTVGVESPFSNTASSKVTRLFVIADNKTAIYGDPIPAPTFQITGEVAGTLPATSVSCTYAGTPKSAGTYAITCTGPGTTSPTNGVTYIPGQLTIYVGTLTITANSTTKTYGTPVTFAGTEFTVTGLLAGDSVASVTLTSAGAAADAAVAGSPYDIVPSAATGAGLANYAITYVNGKLTVNKANATIVVTPYSVTYDGNAHTAAGTAKGVFGESLGGLNLGGTTHTNAGTYTDTWTFNDTTGNYNDAGGTVSDVIAKAAATIAVAGYSVTYDGSAHTATGTATGVKGESLGGLNLGGTTHTNAGTYTDAWTFTDATGNYNNAGGTVSDVIAKAAATIQVTPYSVIYDGKPHTATGAATGVQGEALSGLNLAGTTHTNAGTYTDTWTFTNPNYLDKTGTVTDKILWTFVLTPLKTPARLGSAVPIAWTLQDAANNYITSLDTLSEMRSYYNGPAPCSGLPAASGFSVLLFNPATGATGGSSFRPAYKFNWDTTTAALTTGAGCYTVSITLNDGTTRLTNVVELR